LLVLDGDETAKGISVIDIAKLGMFDLAGSNLDYLKKTIGIANAHYPERFGFYKTNF